MDIRPSIVMNLNNHTSNNFAVQCHGFIDDAFRTFQAQTPGIVQSNFPTNMGPGGGAAFPAVMPRSEHEARSIELAELQARNAQNTPIGLTPSTMPQTFADLSFTDRWAIEAEGWRHPAANQRPLYMQMNIERDEDRRERELDRQKDDETYRAEIYKNEQQRLADELKAQTEEINRARQLEAAQLFANRGDNPNTPAWRNWWRVASTESQNAEITRLRRLMSREAFCAQFPNEEDCTEMAELRRQRELQNARNQLEQAEWDRPELARERELERERRSQEEERRVADERQEQQDDFLRRLRENLEQLKGQL
jgi:hypothetical protein